MVRPGMPALAEEGRVDPIECAEIETGETEAELQTIHVQTGLYMAKGGDIGSETFLIAQTRAGGLNLVGNLVIGTRPGDWSETSADYGLRADHKADEHLMVGLETGGGISGEGAGARWLGPVLSFLPEEETGLPAVELSLFLPLTEETPDVQVRLELDRAF